METKPKIGIGIAVPLTMYAFHEVSLLEKPPKGNTWHAINEVRITYALPADDQNYFRSMRNSRTCRVLRTVQIGQKTSKQTLIGDLKSLQ